MAPRRQVPPDAAPSTRPRTASTARRVLLAGAATFVAVNIWTGAPLLALWVGAQFVPSSRLSMGAVAIVVIVLATMEIAFVWALARLNDAYERAAGTPRVTTRQPAPWLRSMRAERDTLVVQARGISAVERIAVLSVGAGALAFNVWFFFFAGSPLAPA